jgi:hypothetical protein
MSPKEDAVVADVVVFLKTSEEAQPTPDADVTKFTYTSTLPEITEVTTEFDADTSKWQVKVVGTALRDSADAGAMSDLQINGKSQEVHSHSDTMAVFNIIDVKNFESKDVNLFFPAGIPKGHEFIRAGITVSPKLLQISPNAGTPGSSLITATVPGVGSETLGIDLLMPDGESVCQDGDVWVVEYGIVQCWSKRSSLGEEPIAISLKNPETVSGKGSDYRGR